MNNRTAVASAEGENARGKQTRTPRSRRDFFKIAGGAAAVGTGLFVAGCDSDDDDGGGAGGQVTLDFSDDFGVLNYAYALEQLEAAFYAEVAASALGNSITDPVETAYFEDLVEHEAIHRDFFAQAIPALGGTLIADLEVDFSGVDFDSRSSVLATTQTLEDTGVSAYNGAGSLLTDPDLLTIAGKIVSVEARHAAATRALIAPGTENFADLSELTDLGAVPESGFDAALPPADVLTAVRGTGFVQTEIQATGL